MDEYNRPSKEQFQPTLKRSSVSSLCLSALTISEGSNQKSLKLSTRNVSTPSLASTDDESSVTDSPGFGLRLNGWGSAETRRAYADLTALAESSPLLPKMTDSPMPSPVPAPFVPLDPSLGPDLSWGKFLHRMDEQHDDQDEPMCFWSSDTSSTTNALPFQLPIYCRNATHSIDTL